MPDQLETGRVSHVRQSVRGPKTMGAALRSLLLVEDQSRIQSEYFLNQLSF
jgi:hypothetical protein